MTTALNEFSLVIPDNWLSLDVSGEQRIADEVDTLLARGGMADESFRTHRGMLERQLRTVLRAVRKQPVVMAAVLVSVVDDVLPLFAGLTVAIVEGRTEILDRVSPASEPVLMSAFAALFTAIAESFATIPGANDVLD